MRALILACVLLSLQLAWSDIERGNAFIGYTEMTSGDCADQLRDCEERAVGNGCLYGVFTMRTFCPSTCNVERCTTMGRKIKHRGFASPSATLRYSRTMEALHHINPGHWRDTIRDGEDALRLSSLGTGTHLGDLDTRTDEAVESAIIYSVTHGWNVIDTASSFRHGRAEATVGRALRYMLAGGLTESFFQRPIPPPNPPRYPQSQLISRGLPGVVSLPSPPPPPQLPPSPSPPPMFISERPLRQDITRDMLFVSTKAGYIESRLTAPLIKASSILPADVVEGRHCLHPRCLEASLKRSRERLGLETIDVLYLHDAAEVQMAAVGKEQFLERLLAAFRFLEEARTEDLIRSYGLSTWDCFRVPPTDPRYLPLAEVVKLAEVAGGKMHGFKYIQVPVNAAMPEAWSQRGWQGPAGTQPSESGLTLLDIAAQLRVGVFASAALGQGELLSGFGIRGEVDGVLELHGLDTTAEKLLQVSRSTPGIQSVMVGHKVREYVESNVRVASVPMLSQQDWRFAVHGVGQAVSRAAVRQTPASRRGDMSIRRLRTQLVAQTDH